MIRHIVCFKLKASCLDLLPQIVQRAEQLKSLVPVIINMEVRTNAAGADSSNYNVALICDFSSLDALAEYQNHPAHKAFGEFVAPLRDSRACIDYEL